MNPYPILSLMFSALACLLMALPRSVHQLLYYDYQHLLQGQVGGLISGHWIHADVQHLAWNVVAFLLLSVVIERQSRTLLVVSIVIGTLCVDLLLISPLATVQRYCGLSGLLNTLFGVALYLKWQAGRSPLVILLGVGALIKIALELNSGQSVFTAISWPPYAAAHLAGLLGTPLVIGVFRRKLGTLYDLDERKRNLHGNLVASK